MIHGFGDKRTERIFHGMRVKGLAPDLVRMTARKLDMMNIVTALAQLRVPPGNRLEKLSGDLRGLHSIRVSDQYRLVFRWEDGNAYDVRLLDYH